MTLNQLIAWTRGEALYCYRHRHALGNAGLYQYYKRHLRSLWVQKGRIRA